MGSILRIDTEPAQNRALLRENGASDQYPVSCRLYSKSFPEGIPAEVINYHYAGACLKFQDTDIFRVKHIIQFPLSLDFFLGSHLLKSAVAVRVAWHETSMPNFLGLQFLIETRDFIERSRRYRVNDSYQPTISAKDPLDVHRTVYRRSCNDTCWTCLWCPRSRPCKDVSGCGLQYQSKKTLPSEYGRSD